MRGRVCTGDMGHGIWDMVYGVRDMSGLDVDMAGRQVGG